MTANPTTENSTSNDEGAVTTPVAAPAAPGLLNPQRLGYQPPSRSALNTHYLGSGSLRFHALGCRIDGGPGLPPGMCMKCSPEESIERRFVALMMRADRFETGAD